MIVCHCNRIEHTDIERAADALAAIDRWQIITPISVYKELGKRPRCGGCMPLAANIIHTRQTCEIARRGDCPLAQLSLEPVSGTPQRLDAAE
jgi:bacterioferritin-associated ferredoxin